MLFARAKEYGLGALQLIGIQDPVSQPFDAFEADIAKRTRKDVPYLFWAGASWGNWIGLNQGSMAAMAELPKVEMLMRRALELDEGFYYGGPHIFMGIWYASRPAMAGGDLKALVSFLVLGISGYMAARGTCSGQRGGR